MNEREITLVGVKEDEVVGVLGAEQFESTSDEVASAVPVFTRVNFSHFAADWSIIGDDIVIHFYLPITQEELRKADPRVVGAWQTYWLEVFPERLSEEAKLHFRADRPQIVAKYTEEVASWWFCAHGFGLSVMPLQLLQGFLSRLDVALSTGN